MHRSSYRFTIVLYKRNVNFLKSHTVLYITGRQLLADEVNKYKHTEGTMYELYTCMHTDYVTAKYMAYHAVQIYH